MGALLNRKKSAVSVLSDQLKAISVLDAKSCTKQQQNKTMRSTTVCHTQTLAFGGALMYHLQSTASVCSARLSADIWRDSTKPSGPLSSKSQAANGSLQLTECLIDNTKQMADGD